MTQHGWWLKRIGMDVLVRAMQMLSADYGLSWSGSWDDHLDEPKWLGKAMVNTFGRLNDADQEMVAPLYEEWQWYFSNLDLEAAAKLKYTAEVALLWGDGRRVVDAGQVQTILVALDGATRDEALCQLNRECYEFVRWWC